MHFGATIRPILQKCSPCVQSRFQAPWHRRGPNPVTKNSTVILNTSERFFRSTHHPIQNSTRNNRISCYSIKNTTADTNNNSINNRPNTNYNSTFRFFIHGFKNRRILISVAVVGLIGSYSCNLCVPPVNQFFKQLKERISRRFLKVSAGQVDHSHFKVEMDVASKTGSPSLGYTETLDVRNGGDACVRGELLKEVNNSKPTLELVDGKCNCKTADVAKWWKKNIGSSAVDLRDRMAAAAFIENEEVAVVGFFKDQDSCAAKEFLNVAASMDDLSFGITSNSDVFADNTIGADCISIFQKVNDSRNDFEGEMKSEKIKTFIVNNYLYNIKEFTKESAPDIFSNKLKIHLLLFLNKEEGAYMLRRFNQAAARFKNKILFIYVDSANWDNHRHLEFFGLKASQTPALRIITEDKSKYKPRMSGTDFATITQFAEDFLEGRLEPYLKSEDVPADWNAKPVKVLVGKNFRDVAFDTRKAVFVEFHAPWCGYCVRMDPAWQDLARAYECNDQMIIAKMDATLNEIEEIPIKIFPTLKLFPAGSNKIVDYKGERTVDEFTKFLDVHGNAGRSCLPNAYDDDDSEDGAYGDNTRNHYKDRAGEDTKGNEEERTDIFQEGEQEGEDCEEGTLDLPNYCGVV